MRVGLIGLGAMGGPMAQHLAAAGLLSIVGNRSLQKVTDFVATHEHIHGASGPQDFLNCDVVILNVSLDTDVLQNVHALAEVLQPGSIVMDHSTVSVQTAREAAACLAAKGIAFVDAPVSGGVEGSRNGKLSVMVGAEADALERVMPLLNTYAARVTHMGDVGSGQATKAVNQIMVAGINEAVCEALALAEALQLDPAKLIPTLMSGAASNWFLDKRGITMLNSQFTPGFKNAHMLKDLRIVQGMADNLGLHLPALRQAESDYAELAESRALPDADTSSLISLKRKNGDGGN